MASVTLAVAGAVHWMAAISFLSVARLMAKRDVDPAHRAAMDAFVVWWGGLGFYLAVQGTLTLLVAAGSRPFELFLIARYATIPMLTGASAGLVMYLTYLYTGSRAWFGPIALFYAAVTMLFYVAVIERVPDHVQVDDWLAEVGYVHPGGLWEQAVLFSVGMPPILASLAFLLLLSRVDGPEQRYRIFLVSFSILFWVSGGLAARLAAGDFLIFLTLVVFGLIAALGVYLAYHPPRRLAARWA